MFDFTEVIKGLINSELSQVHTAIPGIILSVDPNGNDVDVQPTVQIERSGGFHTLPIVADVPFLFPRSGSTGIRWTPQVGDTVLLIVCEASIDNWMNGDGNKTTAASGIRFSLSDAVAIPGLYPTAKTIPMDALTELEITTSSSKIEIKKDGGIVIGGELATSVASKLATDFLWNHTHTQINLPPTPLPNPTPMPEIFLTRTKIV